MRRGWATAAIRHRRRPRDVWLLTAAVLGGNSLGGGRGSVAKALIGAVIVLTISNRLVRSAFRSACPRWCMGAIADPGRVVDIKWLKNAHKLLPTSMFRRRYDRTPARAVLRPGSGSPYALNDKLRGVEVIGQGEIEGPEDVILDRADNLYCGTRHGDIDPLLRRPTTRNGRSSPISAASRSAWPSTGTAISWSASAAWAFTG